MDELAKAQLPREIISGIGRVKNEISSLGADVFRGNGLYRPVMHLLKNGGKLVRPTLVLIGAYLLGKKTDEFVDMAVAAELLHVSSLIHDDIIDGDAKRRGVDAVHVKYGNEIAILAGDALISKAIGLAAGYGDGVLRLISNATMDMCAGEIIDHECQEEQRVPSLAEYKEIARLKSASLIAACCSIAAVHSKDRGSASSLYDFGEKMGIAFQMRDDIMDFSASESTIADRYRPNVVTSLIKESSISEREALRRAAELNNKYVDEAVVSISRIKGSGAVVRYAGLIRMPTT
jgi:geranylgeranyl pyrophosphate synthase